MNKNTKDQNSTEQFLNTERGKTKSNAIETPSITLPKGGGAVKGIDEKFSVNAVNGTASFSIPLPFSPSRGASPSLTLSYNSGGGNSIFGLGWALSLPSIKRNTDKKLPEYLDDEDSDTFLFSEAEDLVPEFKKEIDGTFSTDSEGNYIINEKDSPDGLSRIRFYKPRIEGLFARIERWTVKATAEIKWRIITKENNTTLFGWSSASRIADPKAPTKIFQWLPEFIFDDKGNCAHYMYKKEDATGFDPSLLHHRNRFENGDITYTNLYPEKILYGNKTPYIHFTDPFPPESDYFFRTVFDYGEYNANAPFDIINPWNFRKDAFSNYKPGFEVRTTRLCKRVLLFHHFVELPGGSALVRALNIDYDTANEGFTFLKRITSRGYIKQNNGTYTHKDLPPTEFDYQKHDWNREVKSISPDDLVHAPAGLDETQYQFTDLFNEGLPGILTEQGSGWYYKHNLGGGHFQQAQLVSPKPSFAGLGSQLQLMDLDADGGKQLVSLYGEPKGYFELSDEEEWEMFRSFEHLPNINLRDANTRMLDLDGDGKPEAVITEDQVFTWYQSAGRKGFTNRRQTGKSFDEETGPHIVFADLLQTIFLADMSGDGLTDIVRIRNGEVCYWPNLGYGKFGARVGMDNAPVFDHPHSFNASFLKLADIDGSGITDIIYLGKNKFQCWMNLNGNSFGTTPFEINAFPEISDLDKISVTDLLGNGIACIVWSGGLSKNAQAPLRYIDLMNGKKPHIMNYYKNNLGKEVTLEYTPSTHFYIQDKLAGRPWITKLHFPVQCISKTETRDMITGFRFVNSYIYHHGYYDHAEREFRGFGMVEQWDSEHFDHWEKGNSTNIVDRELHQEPILTKSWFHTGAFLSREKILNQFEQEYWYEEMNRQGYVVVNNEKSLEDAKLIPAPGMSASLIAELSPLEWREALRACKNMTLRTEVFAKDAPQSGATPAELRRELTPYSAATHNCVIELLQPKGRNQHAVFVVKESEAITYNYERNTEDPRVSHSLNIKLDEYGNVLESASVVYPRLMPDMTLPADTQQAQGQTAIIYTQSRYTNDAKGNDEYRLRLPSEAKTFELKGVQKTGDYYSLADFDNILASSVEVAYHQVETNPAPGTSQKRLIEHFRTLYYKNDLSGPLSLHLLESIGISFESYQLAYTPGLITDIFGTKVNAALMLEGKFTHSEGDDNWWIRSGITQFIEGAETVVHARNRFYSPISYTDPFGAKTKVKYYSDYFLFIEETEDQLSNKVGVDLFNFRTLTPRRMKDANDNISEVISDELGLVKAMALLGKGNEADDLTGISEFTTPAEQTMSANFFNAPASDTLVTLGKNLLQHASVRYVYDFDAYKNTGKPVVAASILREEHFQKNANSPIQVSFEYSNGLGQVVMKKVQGEPGQARQVTINPDDTYTVSDIDTSTLVPPQLRWIGTGRTVVNNKGNAVKQYEPYFSVTHRYEDLKELVETGVTPVFYYDAPGRKIKTKFPNGTLGRVEFDSWRQRIFDQNDTILESSWYNNRTNHLIDGQLTAEGKDPGREKIAADKAAKHAGTPTALHFDTLARPVLSIQHNKNLVTDADEFYHTIVHLDIEGNLRRVSDARHNVVMQYKYDILGNKVYQNSMDSGRRWLLVNILGNPLRTWDERGHELQYNYDTLHRPRTSKVLGGDGDTPLDHIFERYFYGETEPNPKLKNLRGQVIKHYDTGGLIETPEYDFKGQPISTKRKLFRHYKSTANWIDANLVNDLEPDSLTFVVETDAIGRITRQTAPDGSIVTASYNEAGLLNSQTVNHTDPAITTTYIKDIDYNEKGQRNKIRYGNDVITQFYYDRETFRLNRLVTKRQNNDQLQDLRYTFDPVGNISHIEDKNIPLVFFNNQKITGESAYTYDALYRLVEAAGRENDRALSFGNTDNWNDAPFMQDMNPGDPMAMRNYTQFYSYDEVGNILQMRQQAAGNNWTRTFNVEAATNRLISTQVGVKTYSTPHHAQHGFITDMPHLEGMSWNFKEELVKSFRQKRNDGGTPETTYYQYDGQGNRIRKITENQADPGITPTRKEERIYLVGYELYKKYSGADAGLQRISLGLMDGGHRFVIIETRNQVNDGTEKHLVRYQLHNHLGSAMLELDTTAQVISYEEYHPYGTTAYQARNAAIKSTAKRYRYTGMERDEESGLEYHSARYYLPWLGRWLNTDPIGLKGGINVYGYALDNPVKATDPGGTDARLTVDQDTSSITYSTTVHFYGTAAEIARMRPAATRATEFYNNAGGTAVIDGRTWNVRYNVDIQFHDTATSPLPSQFGTIIGQMLDPSIMNQFKDAPGLITLYGDSHLRSFETGTQQVHGFRSGDSVLSFYNLPAIAPGRTPLGTTAQLLPTIDLRPGAPSPMPSSPRGLMLIDPGQTTNADTLFRTLTHEIGHTLGFSERYSLSGQHERYENDFMTSNDLSHGFTMAQSHRDASARFALYVANGQNITNAAIRGFKVDDTGPMGRDPEFVGGAANPDYTTRQENLQRNNWNQYRRQLAPPLPVPLVRIFPGPEDRRTPIQILPRYDSQTLPGSIDIFRLRF